MKTGTVTVFLFLCINLCIAEPFVWQTGQGIDTGGLSRASFPKGFVFGTATSAYQVEGAAKSDGRGPSIWDTFIRTPGIVANNATADVTVDQYHRYKRDVELMVKLNMDAYRFSISWSRIFPEGTGRINYKGVQYYNNLINYLLEKGITPYANLYHYDLPQGLETAYGGLLSSKVVEDYAKFAEFCFKTFGDRVKNWMTFNEPRVVAALGYDNGEDVTRTPRFPGSVSDASASRMEQLLSQGKGRSDWEEQMLRQALSIRRLRIKEVLKEAMKASALSDRYSENLVSLMDGFVDHIIIRAASTKSRPEFATSTFTARAKFCIKQSGVVELVKWLKHNQLSYPRIGMLVSTVPDDLEGLKLRIRWLKSIHVKGRYLGVVLTRQERILRRSIEDLDDNVQFLESHGVLIDWMGFVVSHCPEILSFSMEELKCRVNFFLELGMNDNDFGTMVFEYPKAIGFFSIADMINKVKYLKEFGIDNRDLGRLISLRPQLLACNVGEQWKPLVKYLFYLGVQRSGMRRLLIKEPSIFLLNLRYTIAPKVRFLRAIGVYDEAVGAVLVKFPKFLTYSLDKKIRPVVKFLIERSGVPEADIGKVIASEPELIGCSISGKLEVTTKYFLALGIPPQMLGKMIADFPMLLKYNLSVIRPKYRYLKRVMGRPLLDLIEFPRFFSYSLSSRIIPRHEVLVENSINFPLRYMLAPSDEEFARRVEAALGSGKGLESGNLDVSGTLDNGLQSSSRPHDFVPLEEDK